MHYLKTLGELSLYENQSAVEPLITNAKPLMLLAVLATRPDRAASRDEIAALLWPHGDRSRSLRSLRQALFYISSRLEEDLIESDNESRELRLVTERLTVDLWQFDRAIEEEDYSRAADLYGGSFLSGFENKAGVEVDHWIESKNARVRVGLELAYSRLIEEALSTAEHDRAVELARSYMELNPLHDNAQATLVRTLHAAGDDVGALQAYRAYETLVEAEFGEQPPEELRALMQRTREELFSSTSAEPAPSGTLAPERPAPGERLDGGSALQTAGPMAGGTVARSEANREEEKQPLVGPVEQGRESDSSGDRSEAHGEARRLSRPSLGVLALMLVIVVTVVAVGMQASRILSSGPPGLLADVSANVLAMGRDSDGDRVLALAIVGRDVEARPRRDLRPGELVSPEGGMIAYRHAAVDGWNVAIRRSDGSEPPTEVTGQSGDERPLAWSPDSRKLLLATASDSEVGRPVDYELVVHDLATGNRRSLASVTGLEPPLAVWSPRGDEIAVRVRAESGSRIRLIGFDGRRLRDVTRSGDDCRGPAWSFDGSELAYVCDSASGAEIRIASADSDTERRVHRRRAVGDIVWLAPDLLLVLTNPGGRLIVLDVRSGWESRLDQPDGNILSLGAVANRPAFYVEALMIGAESTTVSPGLWVRFPVFSVSANGDTTPAPGSVSWRVENRGVVLPRPEGWLRVVGVGRTRVAATLHGWRSDSLQLISVPLLDVDSPLEMSETWSGDPLGERWLTFGQPLPTIAAERAPDGAGFLVNNGDEHFHSGVVSRRSFPLESGIALAVMGRAPFTGQSDQEFGLGLYVDPVVDSLAVGRGRPLLEFRMVGAAPGTDGATIVATSGGVVADTLPLPADVGGWQRYVLQIGPEGAAQLIVDGKLYWRHPGLRLAEASGAHVVLGFSSKGTQVSHGSVDIFRGPAYELMRP